MILQVARSMVVNAEYLGKPTLVFIPEGAKAELLSFAEWATTSADAESRVIRVVVWEAMYRYIGTASAPAEGLGGTQLTVNLPASALRLPRERELL